MARARSSAGNDTLLDFIFGIVRAMDKRITEPATGLAPTDTAAKTALQTPAAEPTLGTVDVEVLAHNLARMIEEGGKALAAYMKPREEGKVKDEQAETVTDV